MTDEESPSEELVKELEQGAEFVEDGEFTVDVEQAGDKLQQYQHSEIEMWVLLALEAGLTHEPRQVLVGGPLDGLELTFEGVQLSDSELERTNAQDIGSKFGSGSPDKALELLGYVTRAAAKAYGHARIYSSSRGLCVSVRGAPCKRERELVRERCKTVSTPVLVEFQRVSSGLSANLDRSRGIVPFEFQGQVVGVAGHAKHSSSRGSLVLTRHGIEYERIALSGLLASSAQVVLDLPLPRDLSLTKFLRQSEYQSVLTALDTFAPEFEARANKARETAPPEPEAPREREPSPAEQQLKTLFELLFLP